MEEEERYQRICRLLSRFDRTRHRIIDSRIQMLGIHPGQLFLLLQLGRMGRLPAQARMAEELDVSPALVARTFKQLEAAGYISRFDSAADGRRNEICITPKGEEILARGRGVFQEIDAASFADFSEDELNRVTSLMEKALKNITDLERAQKQALNEAQNEEQKMDEPGEYPEQAQKEEMKKN